MSFEALSTGWVVAIALYVLAAIWVPVAIKAGGNKVWRDMGEGLFLSYVMPVLSIVFWPITLIVAIWIQINDR
jgi:hypothetical protein